MINIKATSRKFNKKRINNIENIIGATFPKEYISFLKKYNGGFPEENVVSSEKAPDFILTSFFGTDLVTVDDISSCFKTFKGRIPDGCVPIARDAGGNLVVLNLSNSKYGYVFFWDHEEEDARMKIDDLCLIAPSFNDFLNMIKLDNMKEKDLSEYEVKEVWIDPDFLEELKDKE